MAAAFSVIGELKDADLQRACLSDLLDRAYERLKGP